MTTTTMLIKVGRRMQLPCRMCSSAESKGQASQPQQPGTFQAGKRAGREYVKRCLPSPIVEVDELRRQIWRAAYEAVAEQDFASAPSSLAEARGWTQPSSA